MIRNYLLMLYLTISTASFGQNVGINATGAAPDVSSMLDVSAANKGILIPRVALTATTDVATITSPATSLLIYNTATAGVSPNNVTPGFYFFNGVQWIKFQASNTIDWNLSGNAGITQPAVPGTYGTSTIAVTENFLGTTDAKDVVIGTDNKERLRIKQTTGNVGIGTATPANTLQVVGNASIGSSSNNVSGTNSVAAGSGNTISNSYSFGAGGQGNTITGQNDIVGGYLSRVQADHSIVVGYTDTSTASATGVFGFGNKVSGFTGFATGDRNKVSASNAFASGFSNNANGDGAIVAGQNNTAASYGEAVFGLNSTNYSALGTGSTFNAADRIFNIGNGASSGTPSDAFTVLKNGRVGINNSSPNGTSKLDITATDKGLLIPRLSLTATNSALPLTKADGAAAATTDLATSLLVYNTNAGITGTGANGAGFYYWNGSLWVNLLSGSIPQDHDWYEVGTTTAPDNINDSMYHMGYVGIGINAPVYPLQIVTSTNNTVSNITSTTNSGSVKKGLEVKMNDQGAGNSTAINTDLSASTATGEKTVLYGAINNNSASTIYGTQIYSSGSGNGAEAGHYYSTVNTGTGIKSAFKSDFIAPGSGPNYGLNNSFASNSGSNTGVYNTFNSNAVFNIGMNNTFTGAGNGDVWGLYNNVTNTGSAKHIGLINNLAGTGNGRRYGVSTLISSAGSGDQYGTENVFQGSSTGSQYGLYNLFSNAGTGLILGVGNSIGNSSNGAHIGTSNSINGNGTGNNMGTYNILSKTNTGDQYGTRNEIYGDGNGIHYGTHNYISGTGTGNKYASYDTIPVSTIGRNFGVLSSALDTLNDYAGFFRGKLSVGMDYTNNYVLPTTRGTNGQIMRTDGSGNVSWVSVASIIDTVGWLTRGNTGTDTAINFLGTKDDMPLRFKLNNNWAGQWDAKNGNYFIGKNSGVKNTTGYDNIGIGDHPLYSNTTGYNNIAVGDSVLLSNISGVGNIAIGNRILLSNISGSVNFAIGNDVLYNNTSGRENTGLGLRTLYSNTTGRYNIANGSSALYSNTTGNYNIAIGDSTLLSNTTASNNIGLGYQALFSNTTGYDNIASGDHALYSNTIGYHNIALGDSALISNTTGGHNIALGDNSLSKQISGYDNIAIGESSLYNNTNGIGNIGIGSSIFCTGDNNIALGNLSGSSFGDYNIYLGYRTGSAQSHKSIFVGYDAVSLQNSSLKDISIGNYALYCHAFDSRQNIAIGDSAMSGGIKGGLVGYTPYSISNNIAIGTQALLNVSDAKTGTISNNIAIGYQTLMNDTADNNIGIGYQALRSNTLGVNNVATGYQTLRSNTTGNYNIATGYLTLYNNIDGNYNIANGYQALYANSSGEYNIASGYIALTSNNIGNNNVALGRRALEVNTSGNNNIAIGARALEATTTTDYNTGIGAFALQTPSTGSNNTALGYSADVSLVTATNATALGFNATASASNYVRVGNTAVTSIFGAVAFNTSDARFKTNIKNNVPGLDFILKLKPVTYHFEKAKYSLYIGEKQDAEYVKQLKAQDAENKTSSGFIAQEVEQAAKELNYDFDGVYKPQNDKDTYGLGYQQFVVPLVKAVQEQQKIIEQQNESIELLKQQMEDLKQLIKTK